MHASPRANASIAHDTDSPSETTQVPITARPYDPGLVINAPRPDTPRCVASLRVSEWEIGQACGLSKAAILAEASSNDGGICQ